MKRSRTAPSGATKHARVPTSDRAHERRTHQAEGPAPARASEAEPSDAAPAARAPKEPPGTTPSPFFDPIAWLAAVHDAAEDLIALAHEGGRRLRDRVLSRAELRRQTRAAARSMRGLLAHAEAGLAPQKGG